MTFVIASWPDERPTRTPRDGGEPAKCTGTAFYGRGLTAKAVHTGPCPVCHPGDGTPTTPA